MASPVEIKSLTGLRAVAALSILYGHLAVLLDYQWGAIHWQTTIIGMPLFFTLSGFVIHYVYASLFERKWPSAAYEFAVARFSRLYPLFLALLIYTCCTSHMLGTLLHQHRWELILSYLTLTSSWGYVLLNQRVINNSYFGISWSVATEWFFYVTYALLFYRIARIRTVASCAWILGLFCLLSYLSLWEVYRTQDIWESYVLALHPAYISCSRDCSNSFYRWLLYVSPYFHLPEFISGCLTCQLYFLLRVQPAGFTRRLSRIAAGTGGLFILVCLILFSVITQINVNDAFGKTAALYLNYFIFLHRNFLLAPGCCLLILGCALGGNAWQRMLSGRIPVFLGTVSYAIYLAHPLIIEKVPTELLNRANISSSAASWLGAVVMIAVVTIATALYYGIEMPAKRRLRSLLLTRMMLRHHPEKHL